MLFSRQGDAPVQGICLFHARREEGDAKVLKVHFAVLEQQQREPAGGESATLSKGEWMELGVGSARHRCARGGRRSIGTLVGQRG